MESANARGAAGGWPELSRDTAAAALSRRPAAPPGAGLLRKMAGAMAITIIRRMAQIVRRSITQFTGSRNGIEATRMKGMAASQPAGSQPASATGTVASHRLERILRTGGSKSATGRKQWRDQQLISPNQSCQALPR